MINIIDITSKTPSCNYSTSREGQKIEAAVLHITGDSIPGKSVNWLQNPNSKVSYNYVIEKNGTTFMLVKPEHRAYHCGAVNKPTAPIYFDKGQINPNLYTAGIACVSSGEPLTAEQKKSLVELLKELPIEKDIYHIIGHNELDTVERKFDPIASYTVDNVLSAFKLDWKQILKKASNSPERWEKAIVTAQSVAKANGNLGDLEILEFLPELIEKIYNYNRY